MHKKDDFITFGGIYDIYCYNKAAGAMESAGVRMS